MKKIAMPFVALVAALAVTSARADTAPGWYAAAGVGAVFPESQTVHSSNGKFKVGMEDANVDILAAGGYAFGNGFRVEAEYFHNQMNADSFGGAPSFGHVINNSLFFNVLYDFDQFMMVTPYIGAGIGPNWVDVTNYGTAADNLDGSTMNAIYQGIAGFAYHFDPNWAFTADYRYINEWPDAKVDFNGPGNGHARTSTSSHNLLLGVRYTFVEPAMPVRQTQAPSVQTYPPARQAVAPTEQNYTVFFDFDKSHLTPEARQTIASAVQQFRQGGYARVVVTGHTDTVGTEQYNQKLSERRAASVRAEMIRQGVPAASIREQGVGKHDLLVPTSDGVREAQNRRAEIVLVRE